MAGDAYERAYLAVLDQEIGHALAYGSIVDALQAIKKGFSL